jgi:predicted nucleotidyltransferase
MRTNVIELIKDDRIDLSKMGLMKHQIIMLSVAGSHMYGTDTPDSDMDYLGIYLPTKEQLLLNRFEQQVSLPKESGIDLQIWSIHHFLKLACQGETMTIDLLHSPYECRVLYEHDIWMDLVDNRTKFYTKGMNACVSFSRKQAAKYGIKGTRIAVIEKVLDILKSYDDNIRLKDIWDDLPKDEYIHFLDTKPYRMYEVCGVKFQETVKISYMYHGLEKKLKTYGNRAIDAKENKGIDWKAVSHALRIAEQIYDILKFGDFNFPLRNTGFLKAVKLGRFDFPTVVQPVLEESMRDVEYLVERSNLPEEVDRLFWEKWLIKLLEDYVI